MFLCDMKQGPRIDLSNVKTLRQGDFITYDGKFGIVIEDEAYTLGFRCIQLYTSPRRPYASLGKILNTHDAVYKLLGE